MANECVSCHESGLICIPRGDDCTVVFTVRENDCDGDFFDISGASEIVFIVADTFDGTVRITKRLSTGGISIAGNGYQFWTAITDTETATLVRTNNYFEAQVTTSLGLKKTVARGVFKAQDTMIKDLP